MLFKRADGYHALDSIMQTIDLCDTVTVERAREILVTSTGMTLPYDNTIRRAAEGYRADGQGVYPRGQAHIPAEAGLGGGSADAAATLNALQELYGEVDEKSLYWSSRRRSARTFHFACAEAPSEQGNRRGTDPRARHEAASFDRRNPRKAFPPRGSFRF